LGWAIKSATLKELFKFYIYYKSTLRNHSFNNYNGNQYNHSADNKNAVSLILQKLHEFLHIIFRRSGVFGDKQLLDGEIEVWLSHLEEDRASGVEFLSEALQKVFESPYQCVDWVLEAQRGCRNQPLIFSGLLVYSLVTWCKADKWPSAIGSFLYAVSSELLLLNIPYVDSLFRLVQVACSEQCQVFNESNVSLERCMLLLYRVCHPQRSVFVRGLYTRVCYYLYIILNYFSERSIKLLILLIKSAL
jgi:hypothetical protein